MASHGTPVRRDGSGSHLESRGDSQPLDADLQRAWSSVRLAALLVDLESLKVRAITPGALSVLGRPAAESVVGTPAVDLVDPTERDEAAAALESMQSGTIDFYRAHRRIPGSASTWMTWAWSRVIELGGRRFAFVTYLQPDAQHQGPAGAVKEFLEHIVSVGIASAEFDVRYASVEPDNPLGIRAEDLVGTRLTGTALSPDIQRVATHRAPSYEGVSFALPVEVASQPGPVVTLTCVVTSLVGSPDRLFLLSLPSSPPRVSELERHLWRIAAEVEASGILLHLGSIPARALSRRSEAAALTPRQWDILRRIVGGERVPTIAKELFLSQSTVRNHLSAIFDRFGVHSQAELLALLSKTDATSA